MAQERDVPDGLFDRIAKLIDEKLAGFARSGFLRNASISGGAGLTIKDGGRLSLVTPDGVTLFYVGPVLPSLPDDTRQQGWIVKRADGSNVLDLFDADTSDGVRQALNWRDRSGNAAFADDTDGGQGIARPYLSGSFVRTRFIDFAVSSTSATFETVFDQRIIKQQPRLEVWYRASTDTAGATGDVRVMINGVQLGATQSHTFSVDTRSVGPLPVAGAHMSTMVVEIQARRTSGSGVLRVEPITWIGRQS